MYTNARVCRRSNKGEIMPTIKDRNILKWDEVVKDIVLEKVMAELLRRREKISTQHLLDNYEKLGQ